MIQRANTGARVPVAAAVRGRRVGLAVAAALAVLAGCGMETDVGFMSGNQRDAGRSAAAGLSETCTTTSDGTTHCPDERQRYAAWDSYAIGDDGRTVTVTFHDVPSPCVEVADLRAEVLPTEVHLTLSLVDIEEGCGDPIPREAAVTLAEPVAGRPVYSAIIGGADDSTGSRGYAGSVSGPQCHGPGKPAPRAFVTDCPAPTTRPPPPIRTTAEDGVKRARAVPWTALSVADDDRTIEVQWISTGCARLHRVKVINDNDEPPAVLIAIRESRCTGATVVRSTTLRLDEPIGNRIIIDATQAVR